MARRLKTKPDLPVNTSRSASDSLVNVQMHSLRWHVLPRYHQHLIAAGGPDWTDLDNDPRTVLVKSNPQRRVYKTTLDGIEFYIKLYLQTGPADRFKWQSRGVPGKIEFENLQYARRNKVNVIPAVAWAAGRINNKNVSLLLSKSLGNVMSFEDVLWKRMGDNRFEKREFLADFLQKAGKLVAFLHISGLRHGDLHTGNILFYPATEKNQQKPEYSPLNAEKFDAALSDLQNVRIYRQVIHLRSGAFRRWRLHNLARLVGGIMDRIDEELLAQFIDNYIFTLREHHQEVPADARARQHYRNQIIDLARRKQREFRRRRDRRVFRHSRYTGRLELEKALEGWAFRRWRTPMDFSPVSFLHFELADWRRLLKAPERLCQTADLIDRKKYVTTYSTNINVSGNSCDVFMKRFNPLENDQDRPRFELPDQAKSWWANAFKCIHREIPVPWPLAVVERKKHGLVQESFYIYEKVPACRSLSDLLETAEGPGRKNRLAAAVGALLAQLEAVDLQLNQCSAKGIWINTETNCAYLNDLKGLKLRGLHRGPFGRHTGIHHLALALIDHEKINAHDFLRLFNAYIEELPDDFSHRHRKRKLYKRLVKTILRKARRRDIPWLARERFHNILIIKPSSLGDIVRTYPVLHALRRKYPEARISWLVRPDFKGILTASTELDELIEFDRRQFGRIGRDIPATFKFAGFITDLIKRKYDLVLDVQGLFRSAFISLCSGAKVRLGFAHAREMAWLFYTDMIKAIPENEHIVESNWRFARAFGLHRRDLRFAVPVKPDTAKKVCKILENNGLTREKPFAVLLVGGTEPSKCWPPERFACLADWLGEKYDMPCVLVGAGQREKAVTNSVIMMARRQMVSLVDQTNLEEMAAVLRMARLVVGNDSGPLHVAAALGVTTIGLYGPTNPAVVGPYGQIEHVVQAGASHKRQGRYSPRAEHAMETIKVSEVIRRIEAMMAEKPDKGI